MVSSQVEEWDDMTQQRQDEITAGIRLAAAIRDAERAEYRGRLTRYSRPAARAIEAMRNADI
jgi:hypothetical protein